MRPRVRRALSASLACLLAALLAGGTAHARAKLSLLVVPTASQAENTAARLRVSGRQMVERTGRFQLIPEFDALDPQSARARQIRVQEGNSALQSARSAYDELDTSRALTHANRAIQAFGETDVTANFSGLVAAWILRIASMVANGENRAAEFEIDRLIAIQPSVQFSPNFFPPEVIAYAERSRKNVMAASEILEIQTVPPGAEVYVNGRFQGLSPLTAKGLAGSDHYVTAHLPGYGLAQQQARPGKVELGLKPLEGSAQYQAAVDRIAKNPKSRPRDAAAIEYGVYAGADQVLLVILEVAPGANQGRLIGLRLDPKDGHNFSYRSEMMPVDAVGDRAEAFLAALLGADDVRREGPLTHYEELDPAALRRMAGLGLLGLGVLAVGAGALFGIQASGTHAEWLTTPQTSAESSALESTGKRQAAMADVSFILAALAAGGGGLLTFTGESSTGPSPGKGQAATPAAPSSTAPGANAAAGSPSPAAPPEINSTADATGEPKSVSKGLSDDEVRTQKALDKKKKKKRRRATGENVRGDR